jgi:AcrR family transcriptional regulator
VIGRAQRDRIVRAMIAATSELGYANAMIADVVRRARVSRKAFYEHFADKESCLLAAAEVGTGLMFSRIERAVRQESLEIDPVRPLRAGLRAYLCFLADEPEFARVFLIEGVAGGLDANASFAAAHERLAELNRRWYAEVRRINPAWPPVPDDAYVALVGAVHELAASRVRSGRFTELVELEDVVVALHLTVLTRWSPGLD